MTAYLIDTNVISELAKSHRNESVRAWIAQHGDAGYLSVLTIGELLRGAAELKQRDAARASALETWVEALSKQFAERLLPVDETVMECWAQLPTERTLPAIDSLLAATALDHSLVIATRNTAGFADTGVQTVDPFEPGAGATKPAKT